MSILLLPNELLILIAAQLEGRDLNALLRTHSSLYSAHRLPLPMESGKPRFFHGDLGSQKRLYKHAWTISRYRSGLFLEIMVSTSNE